VGDKRGQGAVCEGWSQVFVGYEQVFVDDLSEGEWERRKRGVTGDTGVLGEGFLGTELGG